MKVAQASASVVAGDEVSARMAAPTSPPAAPARTFRRASRELAATSWSGSLTRAGTSAWRITPEALAETSSASAKK